jgi:hypothetical protein
LNPSSTFPRKEAENSMSSESHFSNLTMVPTFLSVL